MGCAFFQTAPHAYPLRIAVFLNVIAFIFLVFGFGYSYQYSASALELSSDMFAHTDADVAASVFAKVSPVSIRLVNQSIVCPRSDAGAAAAAGVSIVDWSDCDSFVDSSRAALGFDGITFLLLVVVFCVQRALTASSTDEQDLAGWFLVLQLVPVATNLIARCVYDGAAMQSAIRFLRTNHQGPSQLAFMRDDDVGLFYSEIQQLHVAVTSLLAGALALVGCKYFHTTVLSRIDEVELNRECSARLRSDNPNARHPPLRWMLDPRHHPLFDDDELAEVRRALAEDAASESPSPAMDSLRRKLRRAEREWQLQREELERERAAFAQYSHRIRREERVLGRIVVDDWERQQQVWVQKKEEVLAEFGKMGIGSNGGGAARPAAAAAAAAALVPPAAVPTVEPLRQGAAADSPAPPSAAAAGDDAAAVAAAE